ncbi:hypothetical protein ZWY2020_019437 [Hordeum vulgare]|nr:hypothetical protein ZWY2020_019437 [Hordeum vulgare]
MESFKTAGLPRVQLILPIPIAQRDGGGAVLYFTFKMGESMPTHPCLLNMHNLTLRPPPGLLDLWRPTILCCNFFKHVEFATMPDNTEEEEIDVLARKRRRRRRKRKMMKICL